MDPINKNGFPYMYYYKAVFEAAPFGIAIVDKNGNLIHCNQAMADIVGYTIEELVATSFEDFTHPQDLEREWPLIKELWAGKTNHYTMIKRYIHKDGRTVWVEVNATLIRDAAGRPEFGYAFAKDITQEKKIEDELDDYRRILTSIFSALEDLLMVIDKDYRIRFCNWKQHEWVPEGIRDTRPYCYKVMKDLDAPCDYCPPAKTFKDAKPRFYEDRNPIDGSCKEIRVLPIFNKEGKVEYVIENVRDVTKSRKAMEEIKQLLEEKEMLLKEVHHRIKNDMNIVSALLALQASTLENEEGVNALNEAGNRISLMQNIYETLYTVDNFRNLHIKTFLTDLIDELKKSYHLGTTVAVRMIVEDIVVPVKQSFPLGIIINELISNSYKYAFIERDEGEISVALSRKADGTLDIVVADNGKGISTDIIDKHRYGFGLNLVETLVQQLGGCMEIIGQNGHYVQGSTIYIFIPTSRQNNGT